MKILLRNTKTHQYASGDGQWIHGRSNAHDFGKSQQAYQHAREHQLENAEVVFAHDNNTDAFTLPPRKFPLVPNIIKEAAQAATLPPGDDPATPPSTPPEFPIVL